MQESRRVTADPASFTLDASGSISAVLFTVTTVPVQNEEMKKVIILRALRHVNADYWYRKISEIYDGITRFITT